MKHHKCPYLQNGLFCTFRRNGFRKSKARCGFNNIDNCPLLNQSKSILSDYVLKQKKCKIKALKREFEVL